MASRSSTAACTATGAATAKIRFEATLQRPAEPGRGAAWWFLVLPRGASSKLPSRSMMAVDGTLNAQPFQATLAPDGQKGHWLKVTRRMREAAGADEGDTMTVEITPVTTEPEAVVPPDLRKAFVAQPEAAALWKSLTPVARRDWIQWITSAKQANTRARRIANTCDMLVSGKRRVCCFDRSGFYSKGFSAPKAAD